MTSLAAYTLGLSSFYVYNEKDTFHSGIHRQTKNIFEFSKQMFIVLPVVLYCHTH